MSARPRRSTPSASSRRRIIPGRKGWITIIVVLLVAIGGAFFASDERHETPAETGTALALLETLPVKGSAPGTGYDRVGRFGESWLDVDGNGCDTRNDILQRDLSDVALDGSCRVLTGTLDDPFTGEEVAFTRGVNTSHLVQIDHVVALKDAWRTGAQQLSQEQRVAFANDPVNLIAVSGSANAQKGDGNAATWLPSNRTFRCEYVARQISAKATYGLWVVEPEKDAMVRVLESCPDQPAYASGYAAVPAVEAPAAPPVVVAPEPAPAPEAAPDPEPAPVHYQNCDAARAAGAAPVYRDDPGYGKHLDRDGDGVGCE